MIQIGMSLVNYQYHFMILSCSRTLNFHHEGTHLIILSLDSELCSALRDLDGLNRGCEAQILTLRLQYLVTFTVIEQTEFRCIESGFGRECSRCQL